ncbi:MAG: DUF4040 domain-containing protein [Phycisphaerales bacterium]|nr:MAG: DUF4040 domain-containing protein [Phycisphaerales bacterium]
MPPLFDVLLAIAIVVLAWRALVVRQAFTAVVLFIVYGVVLSIGWVRLYAPDVALAEAAIGAGLTGALLLDAVGSMERRPPDEEHEEGEADNTSNNTDNPRQEARHADGS